MIYDCGLRIWPRAWSLEQREMILDFELRTADLGIRKLEN